MSEIMKLYASLHSHSTHSDGVYTPTELAGVAHAEGYHAMALTDHDTVTGCDEATRECKRLGLECIFGVEFTSHSPITHRSYHLTAFHFDPEHPEMKEYLWKLSANETNQTKVLFERGVENGYINGVTWEEVLDFNRGISWLCNEHVFRCMKAKGLITDLEYPDFFSNVFGKHRSEVPPIYGFMPTEELIDLVHRASGIICLAHPHTQLDTVESLVSSGLDGIEVWHSLLDASERREALRLAEKHDLYVSGGSDHEGLLGGEYARYEHPEETEFWFPPLSLGTTEFFFNEIKDMKKNPARGEIFRALLENDSLWERTR